MSLETVDCLCMLCINNLLGKLFQWLGKAEKEIQYRVSVAKNLTSFALWPRVQLSVVIWKKMRQTY